MFGLQWTKLNITTIILLSLDTRNKFIALLKYYVERVNNRFKRELQISIYFAFHKIERTKSIHNFTTNDHIPTLKIPIYLVVSTGEM